MCDLKEKTLATPLGEICYWTNEIREGRRTLFFLPGLTADHRLFRDQIPHFAEKCNVLVWDAPGHYLSRPFSLDFSLRDKAVWVRDILEKEGLSCPVLIGQSMGGYVSQMFLQLFPGEAAAFISIDSAPLKREYLTAAELWLLKRMTPVYKCYPHKPLVRAGVKGTAVTERGRALMEEIWSVYSHEEFAALAGHGYRILAEAIEEDLPYEIDCPAILICGEKDKAGSTKRYNKNWTKRSGIHLHWVEGAGHNSNTDCPDEVNDVIERFLWEKLGTDM